MTKTPKIKKPKKTEPRGTGLLPKERAPKLGIEDMIVALCTERGVGRSISPMQVAKTFAEGRKGEGAQPSHWARDVRSAAIGLARVGKVSVFRKGKAVEGDDLKTLKGVYRLGLPRPEGAADMDDEADEG
jgi:hypothetical protein